MDKILIVDGNSILNRAFYGLMNQKMLSSADGTPTNAVYGFLTILLKQYEEVEPQYLCVTFDLKGPTFRHEKFEGYKAQRKGMPEELAVQMPLIKKVLDALGIKRLECQGYEGDDIIGSLASQAENEGILAYVLTGDKDALQLASEKVTIRLPITRSKNTEVEIYDENQVLKKYGIKPAQMIELKALMGDSSDNIPGVKGVGEKTALELIQNYNDLEGVFAALDKGEISKKALSEKLTTDKEVAFLSRELATIHKNVPNLPELNELKFDGFYCLNSDKKNDVYALFKSIGFKSLISKLNLDSCERSLSTHTTISHEIVEIKTCEQLKKLVAEIYDIKKLSVYCDITRNLMGAELNNVGVSTDGSIGYKILFSKVVPAENLDALIMGEQMSQGITELDFKEIFAPLLGDESILKFGHDIKLLIFWLFENKCNVSQFVHDSAVEAYVINPTLGNRGFDELCEAFISVEAASILDDCAHKVCYVEELCEKMFEKIEQDEQIYLYKDIELPLVEVLASMENEGFKVDKQQLIDYQNKIASRILELEEKIYEIAEDKFNINSPKQLGVVLFEKLGLPAMKKTKSGYSTDAEVLEHLYPFHEIIGFILEYRQMAKLKSTYADGLLNNIRPDNGRLQTSFNQLITLTGRLSSTEPNLQNIPTRHEMGREIRKMFVAKDDEHILVDADYSQIELRILAHISNDKNMIDAFINGEDIHSITASKIYGVALNEVTAKMRSNAKAVNFGIVYGISDFGLSRDTGLSVKEAKKFITEYLNNFSGVKNYMDTSKELGKTNGYAITMFNRRRYLPELKATNFQTRAFGERVAMNSPIQGSAADIMKLAMVKVYNQLKSEKLKSKLILQVHDELIIEALKSESDSVSKILVDCMENVFKMNVPLVAEAKLGASWFDAK